MKRWHFGVRSMMRGLFISLVKCVDFMLGSIEWSVSLNNHSKMIIQRVINTCNSKHCSRRVSIAVIVHTLMCFIKSVNKEAIANF